MRSRPKIKDEIKKLNQQCDLLKILLVQHALYFESIEIHLAFQIKALSDEITSLSQKDKAEAKPLIGRFKITIGNLFEALLTALDETSAKNELLIINQMLNNAALANPIQSVADFFDDKCNAVLIALKNSIEDNQAKLRSSVLLLTSETQKKYLATYNSIFPNREEFNYAELLKLKELQVTMIASFFDSPEKPLSLENLDKKKNKFNPDEMQSVSLAWKNLLNENSDQAFAMLGYFISNICETVPEDKKKLIFIVKNQDDLAIFLSNIPELLDDEKQKVIIFIIDKMGNKLFDLIAAHFHNEKGPAGRDNSLTSLAIKHLIENNKDFNAFVIKSIQPILNLAHQEIIRIDENYHYTGCLESLKTAFQETISHLFFMEEYPSEIKKIIFDFSKKNSTELLGYLLTRFINPIILKHGNLSNSPITQFWCKNIIIFALQALTAGNLKKASYAEKLDPHLISLVYDADYRSQVHHDCLKITTIDVGTLKFKLPKYKIDPSYLLNDTLPKQALIIKQHAQFLMIENQFIALCKETGFEDLIDVNACIAFRLNGFKIKLSRLQALMKEDLDLQNENEQRKINIDKRKQNLIYACYLCNEEIKKSAYNPLSIVEYVNNKDHDGLIMEAMLKPVPIDQAKNYLANVLLNATNKTDILLDDISMQSIKIINLFQLISKNKPRGINEHHLATLKILQEQEALLLNPETKLTKTLSKIGLLPAPLDLPAPPRPLASLPEANKKSFGT